MSTIKNGSLGNWQTFKGFCLVVVATLMAACSGGGSSASSSQGSTTQAPQTYINGTAAKGILMNAAVTAYCGNEAGQVLGTTTTGDGTKGTSKGAYSLLLKSLDSCTSPILVAVIPQNGSTMEDETNLVNGEPNIVSMTDHAFELRSYLAVSPAGGQSVSLNVTPFTEMAVTVSQISSGGKIPTADAVNAAINAVTQEFLGGSSAVYNATPIPVSMAANATLPQRQLSTLLSAIAHIATNGQMGLTSDKVSAVMQLLTTQAAVGAIISDQPTTTQISVAQSLASQLYSTVQQFSSIVASEPAASETQQLLQLSMQYINGIAAKMRPTSTGPILLSYEPLQAKYSKQLGKAILVTTSPNALHIVDPKIGLDITVTLPASVKSINLSPNGRLSAVLHEGLVSLVDLSSGLLLHSSSTGGSQTDAFINDNGIITVTGQTGGQWVNPSFIVLDGNTGNIIQSVSNISEIYGTTKGIYSDLNHMIFTLSEGLSPAQIYAYVVDPKTNNIGSPKGSPYWGDYRMADPFWLSGDQNLLFTEAGTYFHTADLSYAGTFGFSVLSMSHSATAQEAVVLQNNSAYSYSTYPYILTYTYPAVYKRFTGPLLLSASDVSIPLVNGQRAYGLAVFHAADDSKVLLVQTGSNQSAGTGVQYYLMPM